MIVHDVVQGTPEWLGVRAGIPTASNFQNIVTKSGGRSKGKQKYRDKLIAERLMGRPLDEHVSTLMQRGKDIEAEAAAYYEAQRDVDTMLVGFITNDEGTIGASPDRLVGDEGLVEIKVPAPHTHVHYLLAGVVDAEYKPQAQGQLWVTGRKWVDICSYHPEMPKAIVRVERDEAFIATLAKEVTAFALEVERLTREIKTRFPGQSRGQVLAELSRHLRTPFRGPAPRTDSDELTFD